MYKTLFLYTLYCLTGPCTLAQVPRQNIRGLCCRIWEHQLGFNVKFTMMGPYWHHPVDLAATELAGEIIYAEDQPLSYRHSKLESITDISIKYRINSGRVSSVLTIQVRNLLGKQYLGKRFNLENRIIENHFFYKSGSLSQLQIGVLTVY